MSAILGLLAKVPIWAWALLACAGVIGVQSIELHYDRQAIASYKVGAKSYSDAAATNLQTIASLKASNTAWAAKYAADMAMGKTYTTAAVQYALQQQAQNTKARQTIERIYVHDPSARQWGDAPVRADAVGVMRDNAPDAH